MTTRTVLRLVVEITGPWLVGDPDGLGEVDTVPLRDPDGVPQVPATSVAGSLRDHLHLSPGVVAREWMGERRGGGDEERVPSKLRVLGVRADGGARTARRTTTAVNPGTGVAERASLRRDEYVDAPTTLTVHLMHPGEPATALLEALATWQPVIGRRRTNGWGRAAVTSIRYGRVDLGDDEHLVRWLIGGGPALVDAFATVPVDPAPVSSAIEVLRVRWAVVDGLHIGTGEPVALAADAGNDRGRTMEVADVVARDQVAYVPASSWRGVFRAHAGFILRSLGLSDEPTEAAVAVLFGSVERRGLLTFHDAQLTEPVCEDRSHVGIDRITGGARPGLLFGERSVRGTMDLRVSAELPAEVPDWARNLLRHTVRDIADGFLAVGGRTTRGLGTLAILDRTDVAEPDGVDIDVVAAAVAHLAGAAEEGGTE